LSIIKQSDFWGSLQGVNITGISTNHKCYTVLPPGRSFCLILKCPVILVIFHSNPYGRVL